MGRYKEIEYRIMKPIIDILNERISSAIKSATGVDCPAVVKPTGDAKFGDYQANGVMAAAKQLKCNPRQLAEKIIDAFDVSDICEKPEIAGPGFINLRIKPAFLEAKLLEINCDENRLAVDKVSNSEKVVVDFSGPNIAKQMHVGHLRSTIIGDCIARMYGFLGYEAVPQNHIGDWGTQFGMLIALLTEELAGLDSIDWKAFPLEDLEQFYKNAKTRYDADEDFAKNARNIVVGLHNGTPKWIELWKMIVNESRNHYLPIYGRLGVRLTQDDERGESFYKDILAGIVEQLKKQGLAVESEGAICVFLEGFKNKEGAALPFIIQKSDGAFLYATTDLAAMKFRVNELGAKKIIYVTDARQALHFQMLFAVAKEAGWVDDSVELKHITFGTMLGEDGRPFKTRSGETVKLKDLLDEAVERATVVVNEKNPELPHEQKMQIANAVGIGAVKYADYSNNRDSDYVFSFDKMLAMEGNTAPYMQYAYARIKSIERKAGGRDVNIEAEIANIKELHLVEQQEIDLAKHLLKYSEAIIAAATECRPNFLTGYLYELAQKFSSFYSACQVLKADEKSRPTRLLLCDLTARTIKHGLNELLGIEVVEQM